LAKAAQFRTHLYTRVDVAFFRRDRGRHCSFNRLVLARS